MAVIAAFVSLWLWKRRRQKNEDDDKRLGSSSLGGGGGSPGTMATPPKTSEVAGGQPAAGWDSSKRRSHLMPVDPRLDPYAKGIYAGNQNRSRDSVNSLQDNQDYSRRVIDPPRVLRATNPDPEADD